MVDITAKSNTLRIAVAQAIVQVSKPETIEAIINKTVPKGDVFEMAKTAGFFAVKKTPDLLPDCHIIPIESTKVTYEIKDLSIYINIEVKTIYKTGVEVEAMHGASVIALTIYDMLKPIDKGIEIQNIKLLKKKGGKSSYGTRAEHLKAAVFVCSDSISAGKKEDKAGKVLVKKLTALGMTRIEYKIIPDNEEQIRNEAQKCIDNKMDIVLFTGGTGLSPKDLTPDALIPLLERRIPGVEEQIRNYGQQRTPYAMLSRSVCGMTNDT
ncbi:MAG: bifunctional molybdenum cofactor biosynthesis protein MoaC/MoaB, partial [Flavobacteriales bacterium]|nr:bifunctional molybdenum cofactor biosynthesis protein MoaC/MoaB [Flavobacteriales bacterium]